MVVEFGADFVPVVFLTADNVDIGENDAVVVEGDVLPEEELLGSGAAYEDEMAMEGMDMTGEEVQPAKDPLLSSPVFVGGVSLGVLVVGGVLGFLLARRKIKKGIEIYEDI